MNNQGRGELNEFQGLRGTHFFCYLLFKKNRAMVST